MKFRITNLLQVLKLHNPLTSQPVNGHIAGCRDCESLDISDFRSPILSGVGAALIKRNFSPNFALKHLLKDANLIDRFAQDLNSPIPAIAAIRETIKSAVNQGWGEENASAMIKTLEQQGHVQIGSS